MSNIFDLIDQLNQPLPKPHDMEMSEIVASITPSGSSSWMDALVEIAEHTKSLESQTEELKKIADAAQESAKIAREEAERAKEDAIAAEKQAKKAHRQSILSNIIAAISAILSLLGLFFPGGLSFLVPLFFSFFQPK